MGAIDVEDVLPVLKSLCIPTWSKRRVNHIIKSLDEKKDGNITREAFLNWFEDEVN